MVLRRTYKFYSSGKCSRSATAAWSQLTALEAEAWLVAADVPAVEACHFMKIITDCRLPKSREITMNLESPDMFC